MTWLLWSSPRWWGGVVCTAGVLTFGGCGPACPAADKPPLEVRVGRGEVSDEQGSPWSPTEVEVWCGGEELELSCREGAGGYRCILADFPGYCEVDIKATVGEQTFERSVKIDGSACVSQTKMVCLNGPCDDVAFDDQIGEIELTP